ncbi:MAG TPA: hypothetical protein VFK06_16035 [Candidatus Angelobacter sp.]|nr:hypothetical protein [Candidatus Angelobacter sp.]
MSFNEEMVKIAEEWQEQQGASAIDVEAAVDYALTHKLYRRQPPTQRELCSRDMRRALQQAKFIDAQGNEVRAKHALRIVGEQMELPLIVYVDPRTAKPDIMYKTFEQSLGAIKNYVRRHAIEKRSYDLNNIYNATLPLFDYDFTLVAEDTMMTGEYDDTYESDDLTDPEPTKK